MANHDAFSLLREDHRSAEKLMEQIANTTENAEKTRTELFEELKEALENHSTLEKDYLYPALEEVDATRTMAMEAVAEHEHMEQMLDEISELDETSEEWTARFKLLKETVEHHIHEEETELFPMAQSALGEQHLTTLTADISKAKKEEEEDEDSLL